MDIDKCFLTAGLYCLAYLGLRSMFGDVYGFDDELPEYTTMAEGWLKFGVDQFAQGIGLFGITIGGAGKISGLVEKLLNRQT